MMVPPLSERPVTDEDEEQFRRESAPRKYTLRRRWADYRAEVKARRPKSVRARARAWLHVEPFYWWMRVAYVALAAGAVFAVYINGVAEGWWPAWGERPTVAATTTAPINPAPTASATASGEAAMSGGYQIGPDGVLVRPAEHAASTYTKPELPEEAKQNTERGAELAAEYLLDTLTYAWNTGDTQPFGNISDRNDNFRNDFISGINSLYSRGWSYDNRITIDHILRVDPQAENDGDIPPNSVLVVLLATTSAGTTCRDQKVISSPDESQIVFALLMTWRDGTWIETQGGSEKTHGQ
ncbi:MAG: hypothetical protein HXK09_09520 [Actinomyces bouchesdurhonensis]|uniref:DUF6318 domain-containing protein n=1 Tax=Actinomyces bouchesdurhonensis TaxID=1852361 RepID=A0A929WV11_9ACTO|nr:hypothetical protein [Actinomyces bouchesdurhonensis]